MTWTEIERDYLRNGRLKQMVGQGLKGEWRIADDVESIARFGLFASFHEPQRIEHLDAVVRAVIRSSRAQYWREEYPHLDSRTRDPEIEMHDRLVPPVSDQVVNAAADQAFACLRHPMRVSLTRRLSKGLLACPTHPAGCPQGEVLVAVALTVVAGIPEVWGTDRGGGTTPWERILRDGLSSADPQLQGQRLRNACDRSEACLLRLIEDVAQASNAQELAWTARLLLVNCVLQRLAGAATEFARNQAAERSVEAAWDWARDLRSWFQDELMRAQQGSRNRAEVLLLQALQLRARLGKSVERLRGRIDVERSPAAEVTALLEELITWLSDWTTWLSSWGAV